MSDSDDDLPLKQNPRLRQQKTVVESSSDADDELPSWVKDHKVGVGWGSSPLPRSVAYGCTHTHTHRHAATYTCKRPPPPTHIHASIQQHTHTYNPQLHCHTLAA